jgi:hypothetical protein
MVLNRCSVAIHAVGVVAPRRAELGFHLLDLPDQGCPASAEGEGRPVGGFVGVPDATRDIWERVFGGF